MPRWKLLHNPRCSKSREALALLQDRNPEVVEYLVDPLRESELLALMEILVGDVAELVRTKEESFRAKPFALDDRRVIAAELAKRPELLERPIIIKGNRAVVARPIERIELLK